MPTAAVFDGSTADAFAISSDYQCATFATCLNNTCPSSGSGSGGGKGPTPSGPTTGKTGSGDSGKTGTGSVKKSGKTGTGDAKGSPTAAPAGGSSKAPTGPGWRQLREVVVDVIDV